MILIVAGALWIFLTVVHLVGRRMDRKFIEGLREGKTSGHWGE